MNAEKPRPQSRTLGSICEQFSKWLRVASHHSDLEQVHAVDIDSVTSPAKATAHSLVFASNPKVLRAAVESNAIAICSSSEWIESLSADVLTGSRCGRAWLVADAPERAMREVIHGMFLQTPYRTELKSPERIHSTAVIDPTAVLDSTVIVGPHAVIGPRAQLESGVHIGASTVIEADSHIGRDTVIHPLVYIGHSTRVGQQCEIHSHSAIGKEGFGYVHDREGHHRIPHQGRVVIGDRVHVGAACTIDRATFEETRIDSDCILDNRIHIAHNCRVGAGSIITAGLVVAGSTTIGKRFVSGGNVSITGHIEICDNVQLGGVSVVRKNITVPGSYAGNPLQPLMQATKTLSALTRLSDLVRRFGREE